MNSGDDFGDVDKLERRLSAGAEKFARHDEKILSLKEDILELRTALKELALSQSEVREKVIRHAAVISLGGAIGAIVAAALMRLAIP